MDKQVIDIARQRLELPESVTDDEIANTLDGSYLVARIEFWIAWKQVTRAMIDILKELFGYDRLAGGNGGLEVEIGTACPEIEIELTQDGCIQADNEYGNEADLWGNHESNV